MRQSLDRAFRSRAAERGQAVSNVFNGGFNSSRHPTYLEIAIENSKDNFSAVDGFPDKSCTNLFLLGETILPLVKKNIDAYLESD